MNSGASDAIGASHWTRRNWLTPNCSPDRMRPSLNGAALSRIAPAATAKSVRVTARRLRFGRATSAAAGP